MTFTLRKPNLLTFDVFLSLLSNILHFTTIITTKINGKTCPNYKNKSNNNCKNKRSRSHSTAALTGVGTQPQLWLKYARGKLQNLNFYSYKIAKLKLYYIEIKKEKVAKLSSHLFLQKRTINYLLAQETNRCHCTFSNF